MISFGTVFLELVFGHVPSLPKPGEEIFTEDFAVSLGGAVTSASAAAAAGAEAGVATLLGTDLGSAVAIQFCARSGVSMEPSVRMDRPASGVTVVLNFDGDRAFVSHVPRPMASQSERARWRQVLRRERPQWCYLHAGEGVPELLTEARNLGTRVVLDTTIGDVVESDLVAECARLADIFVPNESELLALTGTNSLEPALAAAAGWGTALVVTRGPVGAVVADDLGVTEISAGVAAVTVRDRTGAGDNFAGAMIAALLRGAPLRDSVVAGNEAGSAAVGWLGAVGEVMTPEAGLAIARELTGAP